MRRSANAASLVLAAALSAALTGCGSPTAARSADAVAKPPAAAVSLLQRPLRLPKAEAGGSCPANPVVDAQIGIGSPRGGPVFYLGGPPPHGGYAFNKTVYALVKERGPVLLRGARIDGPGTLMFDGRTADPKRPGVTLTSGGGLAATFYSAVLSAAPISEGSTGAAADVFYLYPSKPGCYALQADGANFENVVVFIAST